MRFVFASAFRRALAGLVLCVGLSWVVFILLESGGFEGPCEPRAGGGESCPWVPMLSLSSWDIAIAIAIAAASVFVAALIYPKRSSMRSDRVTRGHPRLQ